MTHSVEYSLDEERADFNERLGDLDQFVGGLKHSDDARDHFDLFSKPISLAQIVVDDMFDDETIREFLERLTDLDRFTTSAR